MRSEQVEEVQVFLQEAEEEEGHQHLTQKKNLMTLLINLLMTL
jgi:hypothetical protein